MRYDKNKYLLERLISFLSWFEKSSDDNGLEESRFSRLFSESDSLNFILSEFPHITIPEGLLLDFVNKGGINGHPLIFVRSKDEKEITFDVDKCDNNAFLKSLVVENSAKGAWEMLLLSHLWCFFGLNWHALYNRFLFVLPGRLIELSPGVDIRTLNALRKARRSWHLAPRVRFLGDGIYVFRYVIFSQWGGLRDIEETIILSEQRNEIGPRKLLRHVPYDCGIRF